MSKIYSMVLSILIVISAVMIIAPENAEGSQSATRQQVQVYMYGEDTGSDNPGNISTEVPTSSQYQSAECAQSANRPGLTDTLGPWRSAPFQRGTIIVGLVTFNVWANTTSGTVNDVGFTGRVSVYSDTNGTSQAQDISTNRADTESIPKLFSGSENLQDPPGNDDNRLHIDTGEYLQLEIIYGGNDDSIMGQQGQTTILYASEDYDSGLDFPLVGVLVEFEIDDIEVYDENEDDEEKQETIFATSTLHYILGMDDMDGFLMEITLNSEEAKTIDYEILEDEENRTKITWSWKYGVDKAPSGTYEINVTTTDRSGNVWWKNHLVHLVTTIQKEVDFEIEDAGIQVTGAYAGKVGYINTTIACWGEDGLKGLTPLVLFEITDPLGVKEDPIFRTPAINTQQTKIVQAEYYFNSTGTYTIRVEVNPKNYAGYIETNDDDTAHDNNEATITITVGQAPQEDEDQEWYEELQDNLENEAEYQAALAAVIIIVIAVIGLIVMRRRRYYDDEDEEDEDED